MSPKHLGRAWLWLLSSLLGSGAAWANDSTFGGGGADLVPLSQSDVAMRSEEIVLTASGTSWDVKAHYVFVNEGAAPVRVQVGFPEYRCDPEGDCRNVAFRNLVTRVDGKPVVHRSGKLEKRQNWARYLGKVWLFDVTFPPGRELVIEHEYSLASSLTVMGEYFTTYVVRTGASWKGNIGSARFTAILPPYTHTVRRTSVPGTKETRPRLVLGDKPHVELVIEAQDWDPKTEIEIAFNASARAASARIPAAAETWKRKIVDDDQLFPMSECMASDELSAAAARDCKNLIYASKGYGFKNRELASRYYGPDAAFQLMKTENFGEYWVRQLSALPNFDPASFYDDERAALAQLERAGKESPEPLASSSSAPIFAPPDEGSPAAPSASSGPSSAPPVASAAPPRSKSAACGCRSPGAASSTEFCGVVSLLLALAVCRRRQWAVKL